MIIDYFKIIFLKVLFFINLLLGKIIKLFRGNKNINLKDIKKIIFNRKDRIGDAVVTKPFIILFSKYLKEELKLDIEIEVECSKYNGFVFDDECSKEYYNLKIIDTELINSGRSLFTLLKYYLSPAYIVSYFKCKKLRKNKKCNSVYIDLVGDYKGILYKMENDILWFIGPNLGLNNYVLDFSINNSYVGFSKINLLESYLNLIGQCFRLKNFRNYIYKNIDSFFKDYNIESKSNILIFVGNKQFRNLPTKERYNLIINISKLISTGKICVIDDNTNSSYKQLKMYNYPNNVEFIKNDFSLGELKELAKNFSLIIGTDGGGFNYIRTCTDSIDIFTLGNYRVRSIFIGNNKYQASKFGKYIYNECQFDGKRFGYIYKKSLILPSFDYEVSKDLFKDFPSKEISMKISKIFYN